LRGREAEFRIAAFFECPTGGSAYVDEVVDLNGGGAQVFEEAGQDALVVGADGNEAVGAGELGGEVAPGEDEESARGEC